MFMSSNVTRSSNNIILILLVTFYCFETIFALDTKTSSKQPLPQQQAMGSRKSVGLARHFLGGLNRNRRQHVHFGNSFYNHGYRMNQPIIAFQSTTTSDDTKKSVSERAAEEFISSAKKFGFSDFEAVLTTGADDRSLILETGANKYHIRPQPIKSSDIFRGSCTGNPPTERGYNAAKELYEQKFEGLEEDDDALDLALSNVFAEQRERLAQYLQLPEGSSVILCPSGSDAEYIPIAIAKALRPDATITNGVSQLNEIGAGSAPASLGQTFSTHAPFLGKIENMKVLTGYENIDGLFVDARSKQGDIIDVSQKLKEFSEQALENSKYPIIHGVFGGKTGVRDHEMPPSLEKGQKSLGIVDACQGRFSLDELQQWLAQDSVVLFTTSKFYQAPPFCGAVILPPSITSQLSSSNDDTVPISMLGSEGLGAFVTDKELPQCLEKWKPYLKQHATRNIGLALRWEAGLAGMEALSSVTDQKRTDAVDTWASSVIDLIKEESQYLDAWCLQRSIISIRIVKTTDDNSGWLNMEQARDLYRWMSMDVSSVVPDADPVEKVALSKTAYIGQPVNVSETHAIVRIALGVDSLLAYLDDPEKTLEEDKMTVKKLAAISKHFDTLKQSGL